MKRMSCLAFALMIVFFANYSLAETGSIEEMQKVYAELLVGKWQADDGSGHIVIEEQDIYFYANGDVVLRQDGTGFMQLLLSADKNTICLIDTRGDAPDPAFYIRSDEGDEEGKTALPPTDGYSCQQIFEMSAASVVWLQTSNGGGTGFYIDENTLLTNNHVISGAQWINAVTVDGGVYPVTQILGRSENPDLALLHIDHPGKPLPLNTHGVSTGEAMCIIGAPMGIYPSISNGIVMKEAHEDNGVNFILTNVHSIGGNSGGPAFNRFGEVIGVVVGSMVDGPNAIDMIIHIDERGRIDKNRSEKILTRDEFYRDINTPDEKKYDIVSLQDAQSGTLVKLGHYEQDNDNSNGKEDILWLVLERNGDELKLLSLYCLDAAPYNEEMCDVTWESSSIRAYLNDTFYSSAFSADEQKRIVTTTVINRDNPVHGTPGGADTEDKVYLLSLEEVQQYWNIPENVETFYDHLYAQATAYCMSKPIWLEIDGVNRAWWWLRSSGGNAAQACEVGSRGYLSFNGGAVDRTDHTIRPVIHVNVK